MNIIGIDPSINSTAITCFELDKDLNIQNKTYLAFASRKSDARDNIILYNKKQFKNYIEQNSWITGKLMKWIKDKDPEYCSIEGYAYGATGAVFQIGGFVELLKLELYKRKIKLRVYDPMSVKMFAVKGGASKEEMEEAYLKDKVEWDISFLKSGASPKSDIIDSYWICKLLWLELKLRKGLVLLKDLDENTIRIFNRVTEAFPVNILAQEFLERNS